MKLNNSSVLGFYSVYDSASGMYGAPFAVRTEEMALRSFHLFLAKAPIPIREDYTLYKVGTYDELSGVVEGCPADRIDSKMPDFENDPRWQLLQPPVVPKDPKACDVRNARKSFKLFRGKGERK